MDDFHLGTAPSFSISDRRIGLGYPTFVIAEAGVNHNGSLEAAEALVEAAARSGADAVKFQTFRADRLVTAVAPKAAYQVATTDAKETQFEMLRRLELPIEAHQFLKEKAESAGLLFLSTPFDEDSADTLVKLGVAMLKLSSGEVTNRLLLEHVARSGRPIVLSTGMATLAT